MVTIIGDREAVKQGVPMASNRVLEVCGAFGGRVLGEDFAAGIGDGFVTSRPGLSQQSFELGEDLLDGIEVGRVFRQKDEASPDIADRSSHGLSLVGAEIVEGSRRRLA